MVPRAPGVCRTFSGGCRQSRDCGRRPGWRRAAAPRRKLVALPSRTREAGVEMVLPVAAAYIRTTRHSAGAQPVSHHCSARPWVGHVEGRLAEVPSSVANQRRCLPQDPLPAPSIGGAEHRRPPHVEVLSRHVPTGRLWAPCTRLCTSASPSAVLLPGARHPALRSAPRCEFLAAATTRPRPCRSWLPWWRMRWRRGIK